MAKLRTSAAAAATADEGEDTEQAEADQEQLAALEVQLADNGAVEREQVEEWYKAALRETRCQNQGWARRELSLRTEQYLFQMPCDASGLGCFKRVGTCLNMLLHR